MMHEMECDSIGMVFNFLEKPFVKRLKPTPGKMLIFTSWLYHCVDPNLSDEKGKAGHRVIISFYPDKGQFPMTKLITALGVEQDRQEASDLAKRVHEEGAFKEIFFGYFYKTIEEPIQLLRVESLHE